MISTNNVATSALSGKVIEVEKTAVRNINHPRVGLEARLLLGIVDAVKTWSCEPYRSRNTLSTNSSDVGIEARDSPFGGFP